MQNTDAPGYFNANGFVAGGTSPGTEYDVIDAAIDNLVPFNPYEVTNLNVVFKTNTAR